MSNISSFEEPLVSDRHHPFPGSASRFREGGFPFPRNPVASEEETNTSAGRPLDPKVSRNGRSLRTASPFQESTEVVVPSKTARFPKRTLPGRCRLGVSPKPAERELICRPRPAQARNEPRFRDPKNRIRGPPDREPAGSSNRRLASPDAENPEKALTEVITLSGLPVPGTPDPKARSSRNCLHRRCRRCRPEKSSRSLQFAAQFPALR